MLNEKTARYSHFKDGPLIYSEDSSEFSNGVCEDSQLVPGNQSLCTYIHFIDVLKASWEADRKKPYDCVSLKIGVVDRTPICIYDPKIDIWVSGYIKARGSWEKGLLVTVVKILKKNPETVFLDLGCNIGAYTLPIAKLGRKVVAVDANKRNLVMVAKSLVLGRLENRVTLIWNAISDSNKAVTLRFQHKNVGGTSIQSLRNQIVPDSQLVKSITLNNVTSLFLNKTVFIKMDIERHEWHALRGADEFLTRVHVSHILMEWHHHRKTPTGAHIVTYLTNRSYLPYVPTEFPPTRLEIEKKDKWPYDIMWIKH